MKGFNINSEKCTRDGICVAVCPARIITPPSDEDLPRPVHDAEQYCIACGHCVSACPHGALSLSWLKPEDCPPIRTDLAITAEQAEQLLKARRSVRVFKEKSLSPEQLEKLIRVACHAPSAKNMQPWHWTVVEKPSDVRRMAGMVIEWMREIIRQDRKAAEAMGFVRAVKAWDAGYERICRDAPHVIVVHGDKTWRFGLQDCTLALEYLELFASAQGIGTCWGGYFYAAVNGYPPLFEALGLPAEHRAYGALMIGYPKYKYPRIPKRNGPRISWLR